MTDPDWTSPDGLKAIKESVAATIPGWRAPIVYAVGLSSASSSPEPDFPHVNRPGGGHRVVKVLDEDGVCRAGRVGAQLTEDLSPGREVRVVDHRAGLGRGQGLHRRLELSRGQLDRRR